jgi:hypothetical protein
LGHPEHNLCQAFSTSGGRLGLRICLRRGCHRVYRACCWNQRYCQDAECRKLVRRWQAAKRQQERRKRPEVLQSHAAAERERRARRRAENSCEGLPKGEQGAVPDEHPDEGRGAWSRSKDISAPFCDRPGCYDAVRPSCRCPARYCSDGCRQALRRVRDRERKWLHRHAHAARSRRRQESQAGRSARRARSPTGRDG